MRKQNGNIERINRYLTVTAVIISLTVVLFSFLMISSTDRLSLYAEDMYDFVYSSRDAVRNLQTQLLRSSTSIHTLLLHPDSEEARRAVEDIHVWRASHEPDPAADIVSVMTVTQRTQLRDLIASLAQVHDEIIAMAEGGDLEQARQLYDEVAHPLYLQVDSLMDSIVSQQNGQLQSMMDEAVSLNLQINAISIIFALAEIVVIILLSFFCNRAIRKTNAEVYRREMLFSLISQNVDDVFEVYDFQERRLSFVSDNLERIFGITAKEYLKDNMSLRRFMDAQALPSIDELYYDTKSELPLHFTFTYNNPRTGNKQQFQSTIYPIRDKEKKMLQHVMFTHDVTEDWKVREELKQALAEAKSANASKQEFLSRMSHEIRTPINAIIGMETLAADELDGDDPVQYNLMQINVSARHLLSLVNDVLDMSKIESGKLELEPTSFNLDGLISDIILMVSARADSKNQQIMVDTKRCPCRSLIGDELRLRQVLLNLVTNAIKYTQDGGEIRVTCMQMETGSDILMMTFRVADNGRGILKEELDRIFLPFERGANIDRQPGTGLGLSISRNLVQVMGGSIWAESVEGKGSIFSFEVPLTIDRNAEKGGQAKSQTGRKGRVLVVEDNEINMEIARELLTKAGYEVVEAENGQEAVDTFREAGSGSFDVVVMDIQMPVMDGNEAARIIRAMGEQRDDRTPILAMTANVFKGKNDEVFDSFITKPIDPVGMIDQIQQALDQKHLEGKKDQHGNRNTQPSA